MLPDLPVSILNIVVETLQTVGVETTEDFQFVQEADLLSVFFPSNSRKKIGEYLDTNQ